MTSYGFTNDQGEPIMDGAAYRFEQQLDSEFQPDPEDDYYYDNEGEDLCYGCGEAEDECICEEVGGIHNFGGEDSWLDGSYEE